ncbi:hypothetical protein [Streptomyces roseirectus]|uniref:hypothetical protein n=1 Tax=Streptomyces roseirectus TaxID=2768066 RepID=UPI001CA69527|nr:hypothetical protein [Streptomyces roseirectus]
MRPAELARVALRLPTREEDPAWQDAVTSAPHGAGRGPAGRSGGSVLTVLIEIGGGHGAWTPLTAEQLSGFAARRVRVVPLDPALSVDGHVVASPWTPPDCVSSFAGTPDPEL